MHFRQVWSGQDSSLKKKTFGIIRKYDRSPLQRKLHCNISVRIFLVGVINHAVACYSLFSLFAENYILSCVKTNSSTRILRITDNEPPHENPYTIQQRQLAGLAKNYNWFYRSTFNRSIVECANGAIVIALSKYSFVHSELRNRLNK